MDVIPKLDRIAYGNAMSCVKLMELHKHPRMAEVAIEQAIAENSAIVAI